MARSKDKLNQVAEQLRAETKVQVTVLPTDLSSANAVDALVAEVKNRNLQVDILVTMLDSASFKLS